jgi:hypothetical protein
MQKHLHVCHNTNCLQCGVKVKQNSKDNKFCSHNCSAIFQNNKRKEEGYVSPCKGVKIETKCEICDCIFSQKKQSGKKICHKCRGLKFVNGEYLKLHMTNCVICKKEFEYVNSGKPQKVCSKECCSKLLSNIARLNPNCGGETNFKKFYYKNILMDSSWEVEVAKLMDSMNIKWDRSKKLCLFWFDENNKKRRYHPDFYLPEYDVYLDTKNKFLMEKDSFKIRKVLENNRVSLKVGVLDDIVEYIKNLPAPSQGASELQHEMK